MKRARLLVALGLGLGASLTMPATIGRAQPMSEVFERGNQAYFVGDYDGAITAYQELVEAGVDDPDVEYNLGTAWAQRGDLGHAMVHFERALWLRPGDEGARAGLEAATETLVQRRAEREGEAELATSRSFVRALLASVTEDGLAYALVAFDLLFFALVYALLVTEREQLRLALRVITPLLGGVAVLLGLALVGKAGLLSHGGEAAIVVADHVDLREGPTEEATVRGELREGDRVGIEASHDGYVRVRTSAGIEGWAIGDDVEPVLPRWRTAEHIVH